MINDRVTLERIIADLHGHARVHGEAAIVYAGADEYQFTCDGIEEAILRAEAEGLLEVQVFTTDKESYDFCGAHPCPQIARYYYAPRD